MANPTEKPELSEAIITDALKRQSWAALKKHLDDVGLDLESFDELLGHLRHCTSLIAKYRDPARQARRDTFLDDLATYVSSKLGTDDRERLDAARSNLRLIEDGYIGLLDFLANCEVSKLLPDIRVSAYLRRANSQYKDVNSRVEAAIRRQQEFNAMAGAVLQDDNGNDYAPDAVLDTIVITLTNTLLMEGYRNDWFQDGVLVVPDMVPTSEDDQYKAGSTELLGICWHRWEQAEERHRFFGGELIIYTDSALPQGLPPQARRLIVSKPQTSTILDFVANERLHDLLAQNYLRLSLETRADGRAAGIDRDTPLLPDAFVSIDELDSAMSLKGILGYDIQADQERPAGLRLIEWLRGYAFLKCLAQIRFDMVPDGLIVLEKEELLTGLARVGLSRAIAEGFVDQVCLRPSSRDLFDCPLVRTAGGRYILVAPGLLSTNIALVVLSNLGSLDEPLSRKGKAFESAVREFLKQQKLECRGFKVKRAGEEYEFDAVLVWGDYVFLFECKNRSLSNRNYVHAYHFWLNADSDHRQVLRLKEALEHHPDILTEQFGPTVSGKTIVPCVLNSLPFAIPGRQDGIYFTDWSVIRRFFEGRYLHAKAVHALTEEVKLLHRSAMRSLWKSDKPSPEDLLAQLEDPVQVDFVKKHTRLHRSWFSIDAETLIESHEFMRENTTTESAAKAMGANPRRLKANIDAVSAVVKQVRKNHQTKLRKTQDRAWRELQKRR